MTTETIRATAETIADAVTTVDYRLAPSAIGHLDAHGLCPSCVEPDEDDRAELLAGSPEPDRAELLAGSPEPDRADHEGPRPVVFDCATGLDRDAWIAATLEEQGAELVAEVSL